MNASTLLAVFIGGGIGSLIRFGISQWITKLDDASLPVATILSNLLATAVLGMVVFKFHSTLNHTIMLMLAVGFCGGFSTFSTFSLETFHLMREGHTFWAIANVLVSVVVCLFVLFILHKYLK